MLKNFCNVLSIEIEVKFPVIRLIRYLSPRFSPIVPLAVFRSTSQQSGRAWKRLVYLRIRLWKPMVVVDIVTLQPEVASRAVGVWLVSTEHDTTLIWDKLGKSSWRAVLIITFSEFVWSGRLNCVNSWLVLFGKYLRNKQLEICQRTLIMLSSTAVIVSQLYHVNYGTRFSESILC